MDKYEIVRKIEQFAPLELAEVWDCSGWSVETTKKDVSKIMLCLTVTDDVVSQAKIQNCDMIISHHPLFNVPIGWKNIDMYCAHTNMDKADGGTTDTLIRHIFSNIESEKSEFVRYVNFETTVDDFVDMLKDISPNLRYVNNLKKDKLNKIAFCAGSGSEFIQESYQNGADAFVTGDLKFHTAIESPIIIFDIGHFESEILVLDVFERILGKDVEIVRARECSPFYHG